MNFNITNPDRPPFVMTQDRKKDICILISKLPDNIQPLVNPSRTILGFNKQKYITTSYANELGFYPVSGTNSGSGGPGSGMYPIDSGSESGLESGSGSGSGFASSGAEIHDRQKQNLDTRLRK